tara:strand:+ start:211 stop:543 length:333 start_codon:yes stop_codon:yes gene_type:complete
VSFGFGTALCIVWEIQQTFGLGKKKKKETKKTEKHKKEQKEKSKGEKPSHGQPYPHTVPQQHGAPAQQQQQQSLHALPSTYPLLFVHRPIRRSCGIVQCVVHPDVYHLVA